MRVCLSVGVCLLISGIRTTTAQQNPANLFLTGPLAPAALTPEGQVPPNGVAEYVYGYKTEEPQNSTYSEQFESRQGDATNGFYSVLLPDGRVQVVNYVADQAGYRATVTYETTSGQPLPGPLDPPGAAPRAAAPYSTTLRLSGPVPPLTGDTGVAGAGAFAGTQVGITRSNTRPRNRLNRALILQPGRQDAEAARVFGPRPVSQRIRSRIQSFELPPEAISPATNSFNTLSQPIPQRSRNLDRPVTQNEYRPFEQDLDQYEKDEDREPFVVPLKNGLNPRMFMQSEQQRFSENKASAGGETSYRNSLSSDQNTHWQNHLLMAQEEQNRPIHYKLSAEQEQFEQNTNIKDGISPLSQQDILLLKRFLHRQFLNNQQNPNFISRNKQIVSELEEQLSQYKRYIATGSVDRLSPIKSYTGDESALRPINWKRNAELTKQLPNIRTGIYSGWNDHWTPVMPDDMTKNRQHDYTKENESDHSGKLGVQEVNSSQMTPNHVARNGSF